ncbi:MAG: cation:proton antiporter, partial [Candidatus Methanomethylophilaceae archaeon]|nr:cation:proton antiporter [Candidatus Methanomethylophilaceae archaeon]
ILFNRIKLPPLIGYIAAGILITNVLTIGEEGQEVVEILSDCGLVLLMFCIGLEINLKKIKKQGTFAIIVAMVQLPLLILGGFLAATLMGFNTVQSIAFGAIISGSSTAVVLAVLQSQKKLDKEHIDMLVLITIMEDIGQVIILSIITPILAGSSMESMDLLFMIAGIAVFMILSLLVGLRFIPRIINWVSDNVSYEVLIIFSVGLAFGMAYLATVINLSMAIGAFLMGMLMSSCRKSKEINTSIDPMKSIFMAMFFISVGMEVHLGTLADNLVLMFIFYLIFLVLKTATVFLGYWIGNEEPKNGFISAISLTAMGEFAFIIAAEALEFHAVDEGFYTSVVGAALLSMLFLPLLTRYSEPMWNFMSVKCPRRLYDMFVRVNDRRDVFYNRMSHTSKRSKKIIRQSLTKSYIYVLLIIVIEIAFYYGTPYAEDMLVDNLGGERIIWTILVLVANLLLLTIPTMNLVNNVKALDDVIVSNAKRRASRGGDDSGKMSYQRILSTNTYIIALAIDFLILFAVPNSLGGPEHLIVFVIAVLLVYLVNKFYQRGARKRGGADTPLDISDISGPPVTEESTVGDADVRYEMQIVKRRRCRSCGSVVREKKTTGPRKPKGPHPFFI